MNLKVTLYTFLMLNIAALSLHGAVAFFSDSATSTTNTFSAAEVFPTATPSATIVPTATPTPESIANHVVISEVQLTGGPGDTAHDFIELYNPTDTPIDLNGFRLVKRTGNSSNDNLIKSWTTLTIIPAHGFYLWASNDDNDSPYIAIADTATSEQLGASTSIALRQGPNDTGTLIDVLSWNSGSTLVEGTTFTPDPGTDQSMERKALSTSDASTMAVSGIDEFKGNGFDTNNNLTDFVLRTTSQPQNTSSSTETP